MANYLNNGRVDTPDDAIGFSAGKLGNQPSDQTSQNSTPGSNPGRASNALSSLAGTIANAGTTAMTGSPQAGAAVGSATQAGMKGADLAGVAEAGLRGGLSATIGNALAGTLGVATGPAVGLANMGIDAMAGRDVDVGKAATQTGFSFLGGLIGGIPGMVAAGIIGPEAIDSYREGYLGDMLGTRSDEGRRDRAEAFGFSTDQTASMARQDRSDATFGKVGSDSGYSVSPGLKDNDPFGNAAADAFGPSRGSAVSNAGKGAFGTPSEIDAALADAFGGRDSGGSGNGSSGGGMGGGIGGGLGGTSDAAGTGASGFA